MYLNFKVQGSGQPVLLIHGLFGDLANLGGIARALAEYYQVFQVDLPNHGQSPHDSDVSYVNQSDAIVAFLNAQNISKVTVIGHSMGGKVAMALALRFPALVEQLIVMDIAPVTYQKRMHDSVFQGLIATESTHLTSRKDAQDILAQHIDDPGVIQFLLKSFAKQDQGNFGFRFNINNLFNGYQEIMSWHLEGEYCGNTLFLKGGESPYIKAEHKEDIERLFPNAKAHVISNTGHWLHAEKPDTVSRVIKRFLGNG
ncbi:alpha/beta hydrolase [Veronia nyctiphanis]|uniref:Alpha/beta hydrolase n=1 Tax=Veronia nyctiphanis TaxID=1278244 RepID=A0A4Q0YVA2_9GAMM|nr:alpha/beta fold hydrolase [Veronia nyctiphanis]RXJ74735.1 alpha/beta hydrolase [Veronia nyctiphanis]